MNNVSIAYPLLTHLLYGCRISTAFMQIDHYTESYSTMNIKKYLTIIPTPNISINVNKFNFDESAKKLLKHSILPMLRNRNKALIVLDKGEQLPIRKALMSFVLLHSQQYNLNFNLLDLFLFSHTQNLSRVTKKHYVRDFTLWVSAIASFEKAMYDNNETWHNIYEYHYKSLLKKPHAFREVDTSVLGKVI